MTVLAADRNTKSRISDWGEHPLAASAKIYGKSLVMRNAAGNAIPGADTASCKFAGVSMAQADNSATAPGGAGAAGAVYVRVTKIGEHKFATADAWTVADIGTVGYISDDQTVAKVGVTTNDVAVGVCVDVDSDGVWFRIDGYAF